MLVLCVWWKLHHCLKEFPLFIDPCTGTYRFFQLATCSKPSIRDNHHKLSICHLLQIRQGLINTNISYNWKFCIALLWKFLCFFVYVKLTNFLQLEIGIAITSKWLHVQIWNLELKDWKCLEQPLRKSWGQLVTWYEFPSKRTKKNQSEVQTVPALAPKLILNAENKNFEFRPVREFRTAFTYRFFLYLFVYYYSVFFFLLRTFLVCTKTSKPPKLDTWHLET